MKKISVIFLAMLFLFSSCTASKGAQADINNDTASVEDNKPFEDFFDDTLNGKISPLLSEFVDKALEEGRISSIREITPEQIMDPGRYGYNTRQLFCNQTSNGYQVDYTDFTGVYHFGEIAIPEENKNSEITIAISDTLENGEAEYYALCGDNLVLLGTEQHNKIEMNTLKCSVVLVGNSASGNASITISSESNLQITVLE